MPHYPNASMMGAREPPTDDGRLAIIRKPTVYIWDRISPLVSYLLAPTAGEEYAMCTVPLQYYTYVLLRPRKWGRD